jgi:hypothetical protein
MIVLDTNVVSEPLRARPDPQVLRWLDRQDPATLFLAAVSLAELLAGIEILPAGKRRAALARAVTDRVAKLFEGRVLAFDQDAAEAFGRVYAEARTAGRSIDFADAAIAAVALSRGFAVATRNTRDYAATGVRLLNPWASSTVK